MYIFVFLGLKAEWHEGQGNKIKIRPELYKKGCVTDIDDGMKVSFLSSLVKIVLI